jgi:hypothetical protein
MSELDIGHPTPLDAFASESGMVPIVSAVEDAL